MNISLVGALFAQTTTGAPAPVSAPEVSITLWELLRSGGWVMLPLVACSVAVLGLVIYCFLSLRPKLVCSEELKRGLDQHLEKDDLAGLAGFLKGRTELVALVLMQVLSFAYRRKDADAEALQAVAEAEGGRISAHMNQRVIYLFDLGALAPMLGLFGTVVGILKSFGSIAAEASPMRTMMLAGGVSQALVATAAGLIVGISAMFFYAYFRGRVQVLISTFEIETTIRVQELMMLKKRTTRS